MFKQQSLLAMDRDWAKTLKTLLEANARWNATRRDSSDSDIRSLVNETSTINPDIRKELLYSWEKGFIEEQNNVWPPVLLCKDEIRNSGKALTNLLEGKVTSQTPSTVKTAAGAVYRKSEIAQSKIKSPLPSQSTKNTKSSRGKR